MARKLSRKENFRIVVEPRGLGNMGFLSMSDRMACGFDDASVELEYQERCDEIASQIRRHVDNVANAYVEYDQPHVCEHCGSAWTETSETYNGGCCDKDEESNPEPKA